MPSATPSPDDINSLLANAVIADVALYNIGCPVITITHVLASMRNADAIKAGGNAIPWP